MNFSLKKELPLIGIVLVPFVYLYVVWDKLPEKVPVHWDINGEIDRYGNKSELILVAFLLPVFIYVLFLIIPKIDPKQKIYKMGRKYDALKTVLTLFMSVLAMIIIYASMHETLYNPNYILLLVGVLFTVLGNFFKTIRSNYFIGIKTPWTLENETVWKETHKLAGKIWFIGGLIIVLSCLILEKKASFNLFLIVTILITIIPVVYSYLKFRNLNLNERNQ
ncbi:SdpI family protein [Lutimonas saemankumensis]|uniref:SdpI family protein n=1 Tax=Lutimonas saemankumensis TaxID=483016 RepID=UPI001CD5C752|nr:SdpI family protein [Lutimonas saemankumensis]MCA0932715.1 SdpI family protein [Lutimonas saemankumensis]